MVNVGLRELRQDAFELVRRVEASEEATVTVAGRPSARLVPIVPHRWRSYADVADLFRGRHADHDWEANRDLIDQQVHDPWAAE